MDGLNEYSSKLDTFRKSFDIASLAAEAKMSTSPTQKPQNLQQSLEQAGWHPGADAHRQAAEWYLFDYEYAQSPTFSSAKHTLDNFVRQASETPKANTDNNIELNVQYFLYQ